MNNNKNKIVGILIIIITSANAQQKVIEYYANGKIKYEGYVVNNTFDSTFISYYENGNKKKEGTYKACSYNIDSIFIFNESCGTGQKDTYNPHTGVQNGTWKYYYENGRIDAVTNYYCDISNGLQQYFDSLGHISRSEFESADGNGTIEQKYYYPNGNIEEFHVLLNSYQVLIDDDERTDTINKFYRTIRVEQVLFYYETGELKVNKTWDDFLLSGKYTEFWKNGFKKKEGEYLKGDENGVFKEYYETGQKKSEKAYKNGVEIK